MSNNLYSQDTKNDDKVKDNSASYTVYDVKDIEAYEAGGVFDNIDGNINMRTVSWIGCIPIILKVQVGLGILSLASGFSSLGYVAGTVSLIFMGVITTYANYVMSWFVRSNPSIHSVGDIGQLLFGRIGKELFNAAFIIYMVFVVSSGILGVQTALNQLSNNGLCSIAFNAIAAIVIMIFASLHKAKLVAYLGWFGIGCIIVSVFIVTIAVGVTDRPAAAPEGRFDLGITAGVPGSFVEALSALTTFAFSYGGLPAFICIIPEMQNPNDFNKSMFVSQGITTALYLIVALIVYTYCGQYIASPVLGSAGDLIKKISYGIALPGLLIGGIVVSHLVAKSIFVRALRNSRHLLQNTTTHYVVWILSVVVSVIISFILSEVIPQFDLMISLVGALFMTFFAICMSPMIWFHNYYKVDNEASKNSLESKIGYFVNAFMFIFGLFLLVAGTYASCVLIRDAFNNGASAKPFSCG